MRSFSWMLLASLVSLPALAHDDGIGATEDLYAAWFSAMGSYLQPDDARGPGLDLSDGTGFQASYGRQYHNNFGWETLLFSEIHDTGESNGTDFYRTGLGVDALYAFGDRSALTPFLLLGAGLAYDDAFPDARDDYAWYANVGAGIVSKPLIERGQLRLRAELRYSYDDFESGYEDLKASIGVEIPLLTPRPGAPVEPVVQVVEVPSGLRDDDGDGVINDADQCPQTPPNTRVDGLGCSLDAIMELRGVTFEFNSTRLRPDAQTVLDLAAEILIKYPEMQVEIAGHTDNLGPEAYNLKLSQGRAQAVVDYLVKTGVAATQLSAKGYGESLPLKSNDSEAGRERNRRVELRIQN